MTRDNDEATVLGRVRSSAVALCATVVVGCGGDTTPSATDAGPPLAPLPTLPDGFRVAPCPPRPGPDGMPLPPLDDLVEDCAFALVPLDWSAPAPRAADRIQVVVRRYRRPGASGEPEPGDQSPDVWVLPASPRPAEEVGPDLARSVLATAADARVFVPDPRGLGASGALGCSTEQAPESPGGASITAGELDPCAASLVAQWGALRLQGFGLAGASDDLAAFVGETRRPGRRTVVVARSFGAWWAAWLLARYPRRVFDGALLAAVPQPLQGVLEGLDRDRDAVGRRFLDRCAQEDRACADLLGPEPATRAEAILSDGLDDCVSDVDARTAIRAGLRQGAVDFFLESRALRPLVPAALHRIDRCNAADQAALEAFRSTLDLHWQPRGPERTLGTPFEKTFFLREGFPPSGPRSLAALRAERADLLFPADGELAYATQAAAWPVSSRAEAPVPTTTLPEHTWVIHGTLDARTPFDRVARWVEGLPPGSLRLFEVADGTHALDGASPDGQRCLGVAIQAFLEPDVDPGPLETCLDSIPPLNLVADEETSLTWFGTPDPFD